MNNHPCFSEARAWIRVSSAMALVACGWLAAGCGTQGRGLELIVVNMNPADANLVLMVDDQPDIISATAGETITRPLASCAALINFAGLSLGGFDSAIDTDFQQNEDARFNRDVDFRCGDRIIITIGPQSTEIRAEKP